MTGILKYDPFSAHLNYVKRTGGSPARYDGANRVSSQAFGASLVNDLIDQLGSGSAFSYFRRGDADFVFLFIPGNLGPNGEVNRAVLNAALTAPRTWTLPPANGVPAGWAFTILDSVGGIQHANTLTLKGAGANVISYPPVGGATTLTLNYPYASVTLVTDGSSTWSVQDGLPPATTKTRFWSDVNNGQPLPVSVLPWRERILVGAAVDYSPGPLGLVTTSFGWLTGATGANWIPRDSSIAVVSENGGVGVSGASRSSDGTATGVAIGVAGFAVGDLGAPAGAWGGYFEAIKQHSGASVFGVEFGVRNASGEAPGSTTPYGTGLGPHGLWVGCGPGSGAGGYGPAPTNNAGAAIAILQNTSGGNTFQFTQGLLFSATAIAGSTGADGNSGVSGAVNMARGQELRWYASDGSVKARVRSQLNTTDEDWEVTWSGQTMAFARNGATEQVLALVGQPNAVNYLRIDNEATGVPPQLLAQGADTDVDIWFLPKGAGLMKFGVNTAKGAEAFSSFITIRDSGGATRKLMVCA